MEPTREPTRGEPARGGRAGEGARPAVLVERALPADPDVRGSASLYLSEARRQGVAAGRRMLDVGPEPAPPRVAACLRIGDGDRAFARRKLLLADDVPVRVATSWFRLDVVEGTPLAASDFVPGGLEDALRGLGYRLGRADETLRVRGAAGGEARTLRIEDGEPVAEVLRASYDVGDTPVHVLETVCVGSRHVFRIAQGSPARDAF